MYAAASSILDMISFTYDYSSSQKTLLQNNNVFFQQINRMKLMACEVFKIINTMSPEYILNLVNIKKHFVTDPFE